MGDQFVGFIPTLPPGNEMPPGYALEGVCGTDSDHRRYTLYYWMRCNDFGPDEKDKRTAVRQAWRHYREREAQKREKPAT